MRIVLIGPDADRARLRVDLDRASITIVGEFATLSAAHAAALAADAFVLAAKPSAGPTRLEGSAEIGVERRAERGLARREARADAELSETPTAREQQVLELLAQGLPNKTIAARLGISDQTVKFHVASLIGKLGASNRTDVVRRAVRRGLIAL